MTLGQKHSVLKCVRIVIEQLSEIYVLFQIYYEKTDINV